MTDHSSTDAAQRLAADQIVEQAERRRRPDGQSANRASSRQASSIMNPNGGSSGIVGDDGSDRRRSDPRDHARPGQRPRARPGAAASGANGA